MKNSTVHLLFVSLLFAGCKKEAPVSSTIVTLNDQDNIWNISDLTPDYSFNITWDANNLYGSAHDSLDLNDDDVYDIEFKLNLLNQDSIHLLAGGMPSPFPGFWVNCLNGSGLELAAEKELMYAGLGTVVTYYWAEPLEFGHDLTQHEIWRNSANIWQENPIPFQLSFGPWYSIQTVQYIGLRKNRTFGDISIPLYYWIELDCTDRQNPKITRTAVGN